MKMSQMKYGYGAVLATATALFALAQEPKKLNVVGLVDDKDNATVVAPAELGRKPETIPVPAVKPAKKVVKAPASVEVNLSADELSKKAQEVGSGDGSKVNMANVKSLVVEGMVIPPAASSVKSLEEAVRNILIQANKQIGTVSSNGIEKLVMPYQQLGDGKSYEIEWRKALRLLLTPVGYNFTEDGELVLFGLTGEVDVKHKQLAQERLSANRTPILFTTNEAEGGMELRNAIRDVAVKANITITTDYMEPGDLYVAAPAATIEGKLTADEIGKAKAKTAVQQVQVKRTTFDTNGQQVEWRTVLREILNPHGYAFKEVEGVVRIAKLEKLALWEKEAVAKKPLTARVIRLYHADPEAVVERVIKIKNLLQHPDATLQATRKKDDNTGVVKNLNSRIQTGSGTRSGQSDTTSQLFDKLVRPRTVPAIIAYDIEENLDAIEKKIKLFDIKEKQVLIEAIIFQLDTDNGNSGVMEGVQWKGFEKFVPLYGSAGNVANIASTFADLTNKDGIKVRRGGQVWMRTDGLDFESVIQLIREHNNTKLLSSPMLVVGDHSEAAIQVSDIEPIPQIDASTVSSLQASSDNVQNSINIQWNMLRSGILMWVAPEITEQGASVRLSVHPQVVTKGDRKDLAELGGVFKQYPVYNYELKMHEMDTRATVPSGATLLFGGLIDNGEIEIEDKVRWLGDLPLIGWLFRSKTTQVVQKNLVIMIRPTILEDADVTGFETNALKTAKSVMKNSGRDLKKTPLPGPYTYEETKKNVKDFYEDHVVKPFQDKGNSKPGEKLPAAEPPKVENAKAVEAKPVAEVKVKPVTEAKTKPAAEAKAKPEAKKAAK